MDICLKPSLRQETITTSSSRSSHFYQSMDLLNILQIQTISITPTRLSHALPSILLGTPFNVFDAARLSRLPPPTAASDRRQVSTGLLLLPSNSKTVESLSDSGHVPRNLLSFAPKQIFHSRRYLKVTILPQLVMTLGPSLGNAR